MFAHAPAGTIPITEPAYAALTSGVVSLTALSAPGAQMGTSESVVWTVKPTAAAALVGSQHRVPLTQTSTAVALDVAFAVYCPGGSHDTAPGSSDVPPGHHHVLQKREQRCHVREIAGGVTCPRAPQGCTLHLT